MRPMPARAPLNTGHRARDLLNGLTRGGCGWTLVGRDRYGCHCGKAQGRQECANSRTICRHRLKARSLVGPRRSLVPPALAAGFAEQVRRLLPRLATRESKRATPRAGIARLGSPAPRALPGPGRFEEVYRRQIARLVALLAGSDEVIAAKCAAA